jgi:hypothetical protein
MKKHLQAKPVTKGKKPVAFRAKFEEAIDMLTRLASVFPTVPVLVVTDSAFGNNGLLKPLRQALGEPAHVLTRLRANKHTLRTATGRRAAQGPSQEVRRQARLGERARRRSSGPGQTLWSVFVQQGSSSSGP